MDQGLPKPVQGQCLRTAVEEFVADRLGSSGGLLKERGGRVGRDAAIAGLSRASWPRVGPGRTGPMGRGMSPMPSARSS